jgi:hypothetical protein
LNFQLVLIAVSKCWNEISRRISTARYVASPDINRDSIAVGAYRTKDFGPGIVLHEAIAQNS